MDIEQTVNSLIQRIKEAKQTGILRLAEGDGVLIGSMLELYAALFELKEGANDERQGITAQRRDR